MGFCRHKRVLSHLYIGSDEAHHTDFEMVYVGLGLGNRFTQGGSYATHCHFMGKVYRIHHCGGRR